MHLHDKIKILLQLLGQKTKDPWWLVEVVHMQIKKKVFNNTDAIQVFIIQTGVHMGH